MFCEFLAAYTIKILAGLTPILLILLLLAIVGVCQLICGWRARRQDHQNGEDKVWMLGSSNYLKPTADTAAAV